MRSAVFVVAGLVCCLAVASAIEFHVALHQSVLQCAADNTKCEETFKTLGEIAKNVDLKAALASDRCEAKNFENPSKTLWKEVIEVVKKQFADKKAADSQADSDVAGKALAEIVAFEAAPTAASCKALSTSMLDLLKGELMTRDELAETYKLEEDKDTEDPIGVKFRQVFKARQAAAAAEEAEFVRSLTPFPGPASRKLLAVAGVAAAPYPGMIAVGAALPVIPWGAFGLWWAVYFGPAWVTHGGAWPFGNDMRNAAAFQARDLAFTPPAGNAHTGKHHIKAGYFPGVAAPTAAVPVLGTALCVRACGKGGGADSSAFLTWADASAHIAPYYTTGRYKIANYQIHYGHHFGGAFPGSIGIHYAPNPAAPKAIACRRGKAVAKGGAIPVGYINAGNCAGGGIGKNANHDCFCKHSAPVKIRTIVKQNAVGKPVYVETHFPFL